MEWREGESEKEIHRGGAEGAEGKIAREGAKTPSGSFLSMESREAERREKVAQASRLRKS